MTRKDRTEGIYSRREVLDESERRQYCLIQLKDLLSYAYRYSEDVKKRFDRAQFNVEKFKTLSDIKHIPILKKKELIFLQSMGPRLGGLLTKDIGDLKRIFLSPGPIFDPEDRGEDYWGYTEAFYSVGFRPGDAVQNTFNYQLTPAGLMFEEPLRNLGGHPRRSHRCLHPAGHHAEAARLRLCGHAQLPHAPGPEGRGKGPEPAQGPLPRSGLRHR